MRRGITDESFLPQIVGVFYATFDPVAGPTVLHQVPERLISSSSSSDDGAAGGGASVAGNVSPSGSRSRSVPRERGREVSRAGPRALSRTASPSPLRKAHTQSNSHAASSSSLILDKRTGEKDANLAPSPAHYAQSHQGSHAGSLSSLSSLNPSTSQPQSASASYVSQASNMQTTSQNNAQHSSHTHSHSEHSRQQGHHQHNGSSHGGHRRTGSAQMRQPCLLDFSAMSEYVIPKKSLHGKLVVFRSPGAWDATGGGELDVVGADAEEDSDDERDSKPEYRVMGLPMVLEGHAGQYQRNEYMWNLCFVFRASASLAAYEPVVRKTARILRSAELDTCYLSAPQPQHTPLLAVLEQIFEDLNSYSETSIPLDGFNTLELKLFPFYPNPPECNDWDVPIALADLKSLRDSSWDITAERVSEHINGINYSARIAQLADADEALVRETLRHMLYYQVIMMYSNMYTVTDAFPRLCASEDVIAECGGYVTRPGYPISDWPYLATLYAKLRPGITVDRWCEDNDIGPRGIDPRRFVSFGIIKGYLVRVHRWPVMVDRRAPLLLGTMNAGHQSSGAAPAPDPNRRRVGFQHSGRESRESRDFRNDSGFSRVGAGPGQESRGESQFTLRSQGSVTSVPHASSSPGSGLARTPPNPRSSLGAGGKGEVSGRSHTSAGETHQSVSSRRTNTLRSGGALSAFTTSGQGVISNLSKQREGRLYELEDELNGYLDGHHHTDEIQVRMGMSWAQLEKVLGLDDIRNGMGRKGVAVVYR